MSQISYERPPGHINDALEFPAMILDSTRETVGGKVRYRVTLFAYLRDAPQLIESIWCPEVGDYFPQRGAICQISGYLATVNGHLGMVITRVDCVDISPNDAIVDGDRRKG